MTNPDARFDPLSARPAWGRSRLPSASFLTFTSTLLATAIVLMAQQLPTDKGVNFFSIAKEIAAGQASAEELSRHVTILRGPAVNEYLNTLGSQLSAAAPYTQFPYSFTVFRGVPPPRLFSFPTAFEPGAATEAIAIAGGPIFVSAQLIDRLDNESELAAVLAHAIAHTALRHASRMATRGNLAKLAAQNTPADQRDAHAALLPVALLSVARSFERQADNLAVQILANARYDPAGLISYLRKLPVPEPRPFSGLPDPRGRVRAVEAAIAQLPAATYRPDSGRFADWKKAVVPAPSQ
jgi:beta-barrel assembly-enhancing protease